MCMNRPLVQLESYASAARTAAPTLKEHENTYNWPGVMFTIDTTAITATPSVTFTIQTYDELADDWFDLITTAAVTAAGNTIVASIMGASAVANAIAGYHPGKRVRLKPTHADADEITYGVTIHWIG